RCDAGHLADDGCAHRAPVARAMGRPPAGGKAEELTRAAPAEDATRAHHRTDRLAARRRFDEVECTVSHLLRFPHPALRGRRYGEALLHGLADRGIQPGPDGVLEIRSEEHTSELQSPDHL